MKIPLRTLVAILLPSICFPITEIVTPSGTNTPSPTPSTTPSPTVTPTASMTMTPTPTERPLFMSGFDEDLILEETDRMERSASPDWWVNSGAWLVQRGGVGSTWIGEAPAESRWRELYNRSNPRDTDQGAHPQNLFRLVTRSAWRAPSQQVYVRIVADNLSASANRDKSNGVLLFLRYRDGDNLYYAGLRVDGSAVIKKKSGGFYTTLAEAPFYPGSYNRTTRPNLIPHGVWTGMRAVMQSEGNTVTIQLYVDSDRSGFWVLAIQAEDAVDPSTPLAQAGHAGIRTDFMDVEFDDYRIEEVDEG